MSWLFGVLQKHKQSKFNFELDEEFQKAELDNLFVAVSNNSKTSFINSTFSGVSAYVGVPILEENNKKKLLNKKLLQNIHPNNVNDLFGHFVWLNYSNNVLELFTDVFGLRELYYNDSEKQFIFSTRIDLLTNYLQNIKINLKEFSSLWLTNFQISNKSIFDKIERLGPGGKIIYKNNQLKIINIPFERKKQNATEKMFSEIVKNYCSIKSSDNRNILLGLSGGIDARTILSLLNGANIKFNCSTLVNEDKNDLKVAKRICELLDINHFLIYRNKLKLQSAENKILNFYKNIPPVIPITQLLDFGYYGSDILQKHILIDGGFGEFYRMQYLKKLLIKGYKTFNKNKFKLMKTTLFSPKPEIFDNAVIQKLNKLLNEKITELLTILRTPKNKTEFAEIADFISYNFKLPNTYSAGQIILDQNFLSFMPFAQKDLLNIGMNISLKEKSDSRLFKNIIKHNKKELSKIVLVKNNLINPFPLNDKFVMLKLLFHNKFVKRDNYERFRVLYNSKNYIYDLVKDTNSDKYFNHSENLIVLNEFFAGNFSQGNYVDWLTSYILWEKANKVSMINI